ncbi:MAG: glycosyltransferase family 4 protein [Opitutaceae bacterium]|nr:glycosyltransferase family 4 protein [Opitutaceae bacterium]
MRPVPQPIPGGSFRARFAAFAGLFFDEFAPDSCWIRESARVELPALADVRAIVLRGDFRPHPQARGLEGGRPGLAVRLNGRPAGRIDPAATGAFELRFELPARPEGDTHVLDLRLTGVGFTNLLAWLGRVTGLGPWQRFRAQRRNRQLRLTRLETAAGEVIFDFGNRNAPYSADFARRHTHLGLNVAGFLTAELGVGESARCMVRAADAAGLPAALVPLKLHCKNPLGDQTFAARLQEANPHGVNVVHLDPPASRDLDHHHPTFRAGRYNIAYWAWELPEFPDAWVPACAYFDEIWCPSDFVREAVSLKVPLPVITMPHAIGFAPPPADGRAHFGLPAGTFLFLVLYDLNSYTARKNPQAAIEAFRRSGLAGQGAALVIKVHNVAGNEADYQQLQAAVADLPGTVLLTETLGREDVYRLQAACDCYVSLHRSEGFGLAVAECMLLGKPVIATDWSATAEFLDATNGCPVRYRLVPLERNHGPYGKGQVWAEADPDHAADWMRRLHADAGLCARLGAAAHATIVARFSPGVVGARYRKRLEGIACF